MTSNRAPALAEMSTQAVAGLEASKWMIIWPVASLEQHGPHLPLGMDAIFLQAVVDGTRDRLGKGFPALYLPLMSYGKSPEHLDFPGTVSLRGSTLMAVAEDIVSSLAPDGFSRFVFLNGHGGNTSLLRALSSELRHRYRVWIYNLDLWESSFFDEAIRAHFPTLAQREVHAASVETSAMLYLNPHLVGDIPPEEGGYPDSTPVPYGWLSGDLSTGGVIGDASQASADKGEWLTRYTIDKVSNLLVRLQEAIAHD